MKNSQLSAYIGVPVSDIRKNFDDIREAFEDEGLEGFMDIQIADLCMHGTTPLNYKTFLERLDALSLIVEKGGYKVYDAETALKNVVYDQWTLLKSAACYKLDKPIPEEFEEFVLAPIAEHFRVISEAKTERAHGLKKAEEIIKSIIEPLKDASEELEKIDPWIMAGSNQEAIKFKIDNILSSLGMQTK
nr:hypothetical protein 7 [Campylobacterota bacterium]